MVFNDAIRPGLRLAFLEAYCTAEPLQKGSAWQFVQSRHALGLQKLQDKLPVPGDLIWIRNRRWRVRNTSAGHGLARVTVDGGPTAGTRSFLLPCDRWAPDVPRQTRHVSRRSALAWLAACAARVRRAGVPATVVGSRTELLAYQLEPALAILSGKRRVLIADDVGLGKTIQAALVIAEIVGRNADARVLVIAPAPLLSQWSAELRAKFSLTARIADAGSFIRLRIDQPYLDNPWQGPGLWLVSPDYLKQPHVLDGMPRAPFDLVVIDEAHAMAGNSQRHAAADRLARSAGHVVMLTATPHDGDDGRFRRLVSLGATGSHRDALTTFRRTRPDVTRDVRHLRINPGAGVSRVLSAIDSFGRTGTPAASNDGLQLICAVFRKRALSSLAALRASLDRRLLVVENAGPSGQENGGEAWFQPVFAFESDDGDVISADEQLLLRASTGLSADRERAWLQRLVAAAAAAGHEPKFDRLVTLLRRTREPVVVFTEYRDSLLDLAPRLAKFRPVSVLHGGLTGADQRNTLGAFVGGRTDVLLATDVASQGLNLQHRSRWVVHLDVPWTPMRLEQRVGRVDRIGQSRRVHVTTIGLRHPAEDSLRQRLAERHQSGEAATLKNCSRWTRAAEGLARQFAQQRWLSARWRGPDPLVVPRARVGSQTLARLGLSRQAEVLSVVEIPLMTATGELVESYLGWSTSLSDPLPARLLRRARALSHRERVRRRRREASQTAGLPPSAHQPGLFDARIALGRSDDEPAQPIAVEEPHIHVGHPRPVLILERRR